MSGDDKNAIAQVDCNPRAATLELQCKTQSTNEFSSPLDEVKGFPAAPRVRTPLGQAVGLMRVKQSVLKGIENNVRHKRAVQALLVRERFREELDRAAHASNSPQIVRDLRGIGIDIKCTLVSVTGIDGTISRPGIYSLTEAGRASAIQWLERKVPA